MKSKLILAFALATACLCKAQTIDNRAINYCVTYDKEHLFLQKDSGFNVVDYDIEWPEVIDFCKVTTLKQYITKNMTDLSVTDLDSAVNNIKYIYGIPVKGPFKTIPDDNRFCYITSKANIVGYQKNHWIAYRIENKVEPQKKSAFSARDESRVVVFDTSRSRLLMASDLVNSSVVMREEPQDFYDQLFAPLPDDIFNSMTGCEIDGVWVDGEKLCFLVAATTPEAKIRYTAQLPLEYYYYALSREGRRVFLKEPKAKQPQMLLLPETWRGDSIYNNVEKMPIFNGGEEGMKQYFSHVPSLGFQPEKPARVYTSFIVDKEGNVEDVNVISPVSPTIDRHAAAIIKAMPKFTPGEHNGRKVCIRMYMPISYR